MTHKCWSFVLWNFSLCDKVATAVCFFNFFLFRLLLFILQIPHLSMSSDVVNKECREERRRNKINRIKRRRNYSAGWALCGWQHFWIVILQTGSRSGRNAGMFACGMRFVYRMILLWNGLIVNWRPVACWPIRLAACAVSHRPNPRQKPIAMHTINCGMNEERAKSLSLKSFY